MDVFFVVIAAIFGIFAVTSSGIGQLVAILMALANLAAAWFLAKPRRPRRR